MFDIQEYMDTHAPALEQRFYEKLALATDQEIVDFESVVQNYKPGMPFPGVLYLGNDDGSKIKQRKLLAAIAWQKLKRNKLSHMGYKTLFPLRKWWFSFWLGLDAFTDETFGFSTARRMDAQFIYCATGLHGRLVRVKNGISKYLKKHHWQVITAIIASAGVAVAFYTKQPCVCPLDSKNGLVNISLPKGKVGNSAVDVPVAKRPLGFKKVIPKAVINPVRKRLAK